MSVAVIADCHLGGPGGPAGPLIEQLEELVERGCERIVFLGDVFHFWVGHPRFETPAIRELVPVLRRLRRQGVSIDYVEGNRDFFLETGPYVDCFDRYAREIVFEHAGRSYLAVHGDGINDRDRKYLFWRWLSKSSLTRFLSLRLPTAVAQKAMYSTEARLGRTNFKHKRRIPEEVILRYAEQRLAEGHDVLFLGHFHQSRVWPVPGGEVRLLDAWFNRLYVEWLE